MSSLLTEHRALGQRAQDEDQKEGQSRWEEGERPVTDILCQSHLRSTTPTLLGGGRRQRYRKMTDPGQWPAGLSPHRAVPWPPLRSDDPTHPPGGSSRSRQGLPWQTLQGWTVQPTLYKTFGSSSILIHCRNDLLTSFNFLCLYQIAFNSPWWFCNIYVRSWDTGIESKEEPRYKCQAC